MYTPRPPFLTRQRPRLSNCHPQFGYKGKTVLPSNTVVKRCVYLFSALRTILFFGCGGVDGDGGLTCNYYKMAHEKDTQR